MQKYLNLKQIGLGVLISVILIIISKFVGKGTWFSSLTGFIGSFLFLISALGFFFYDIRGRKPKVE